MEKKVIGVDIGGTAVKIGIFTTEGQLIEKWEIPTRTLEGGSHILPDIAESVKGKMADLSISDDQIEGVGFGVPGPVRNESVVNKCVNLGWGVFDVAKEFKELTGFDTKVENDANVAAFGEMWQGGGKGHKNIVMVTLGTGVGGGIIINGKIVSGENGAGGEIGHLPVTEDEEDTCGCGKKGCLEQYSSANGLLRVTKKYLAAHPELETSLKSYEKLTAKDICMEAIEGDAVALERIHYSMNMLGRGLAMVACVVDPEVFVIGGGLAKSGAIITETAREAYTKYCFHSCKNIPFELAKLGNDAGIYGAAKLVTKAE